MSRYIFSSFILLLSIGLYGCASGPSYREIEKTLPTLSKDSGRIFFYREALYAGSAIQPTVQINGEGVGTSVPGGFFVVDKKAGEYIIQCSSDELSVIVEPGNNYYIEMLTTPGSALWEVRMAQVDERQGASMVRTLSYAGAKKQSG